MAMPTVAQVLPAPRQSWFPWAAATLARSSPTKRYRDWTLDDPARKAVNDVRPIRDEIEHRVRGLLDDLGVPAHH
jgi:hypothetical protein